MPTGTVKWFNDQKGYGFIQPDQGGKDVFVHISAVERSGMRGLAEGQKASYEVEADRRSGKESATNLKPAQPITAHGPEVEAALIGAASLLSGHTPRDWRSTNRWSYGSFRMTRRPRQSF